MKAEEINTLCDGDICEVQEYQSLDSPLIYPNQSDKSQKDTLEELSRRIIEGISEMGKKEIELMRNLIREELEPIRKELNSLESCIKNLSLMNEEKIDYFYFYFNENDLIFKIRLPELKTMVYNQTNVLTENTTVKGYYYHSTDKTVRNVDIRVIITNKTITIDPIGDFPKLKSGYYTLYTK